MRRRRLHAHGPVLALELGLSRDEPLRRARRMRRLAHERRHGRRPHHVSALLDHIVPPAGRYISHVQRGDRDASGASAVKRFALRDDAQSAPESPLPLAPTLLTTACGLAELASLT